MLIEEGWFHDMNLTDGATFLIALIKRAKTRFNQKINFRVTQSVACRKLQQTMFGTHRLSRYCLIYTMEIFFSSHATR